MDFLSIVEVKSDHSAEAKISRSKNFPDAALNVREYVLFEIQFRRQVDLI